MMSDLSLWLCLLVALSLSNVYGGSNTILDIHLSDLTTDNKLANGRCCQGAKKVNRECQKPCHIVLTLCYGSFQIPCLYGSTSLTLTPSPTRKETFGENIGNTTNPVFLQLVGLKSYYSGHVYAYDLYQNTKNLIYDTQMYFNTRTNFQQTYEGSKWNQLIVPHSPTVHFR
ncbi:uncharacterized protein [Mytilus edulis]|uniref:uncharacterized protein n=1 Tax=Mytilus edulis TaxID=6550 RepID=UPI0039EE368E